MTSDRFGSPPFLRPMVSSLIRLAPVLVVGLAIAALRSGTTLAAGASDDHTVLILGATAPSLQNSPEAIEARRLGMNVEIATDAQWAAKSQADFSTYRALILADPNKSSQTPIAAALANRATWSPSVTGNVIVIGSDPLEHYPTSAGARQLVYNAVKFAIDDYGKTGAYISLSQYYDQYASPVVVSLLDRFGSFTSKQASGCFDDVHIVAVHPALSGLTDALLSNWGCSVHEVLTSYPTSGTAPFLPLAIARNIAGTGSVNFPDGTYGVPYILARGAALQPVGLNISKSGPASAFVGDSITYTITYGNTGGTAATGTTITDPVPYGTTFVSATGGGTLSGGAVTWNLGTLAAGVTGRSVSLTVRVNSGPVVTNTDYRIASSGVSPVVGKDVKTDIGVRCSSPGVPTDLSVRPKSPAFSGAPPTGTDTLVLSWNAGSGQLPTRFEYWLNGGNRTSTTGTTVEVPPRGAADPVQLYVQAFSCSPELSSAVATMVTPAALGKPSANFSMPGTATVNQPVTLTDTSSPQATSWLWVYADGEKLRSQSQQHTFVHTGNHEVALIASNGSGSHVVKKTITVNPASSGANSTAQTVRMLAGVAVDRLALDDVTIQTGGHSWLLIRSDSSAAATVFLRFIDETRGLLVERRLVVEPGVEARYDLGSWAEAGRFRLEAFSLEAISAWVIEEEAQHSATPREVHVRP